MSKRRNDIFLVLWALLFIFHLMVLIFYPSKIQFLLTGFVAGVLFFILINNPLLNSYENYVNSSDKLVKKLFDERTKKINNESCPYCFSKEYTLSGKRNGCQRFLCKGCKKRYTEK